MQYLVQLLTIWGHLTCEHSIQNFFIAVSPKYLFRKKKEKKKKVENVKLYILHNKKNFYFD